MEQEEDEGNNTTQCLRVYGLSVLVLVYDTDSYFLLLFIIFYRNRMVYSYPGPYISFE